MQSCTIVYLLDVISVNTVYLVLFLTEYILFLILEKRVNFQIVVY